MMTEDAAYTAWELRLEFLNARLRRLLRHIDGLCAAGRGLEAAALLAQGRLLREKIDEIELSRA